MLLPRTRIASGHFDVPAERLVAHHQDRAVDTRRDTRTSAVLQVPDRRVYAGGELPVHQCSYHPDLAWPAPQPLAVKSKGHLSGLRQREMHLGIALRRVGERRPETQR